MRRRTMSRWARKRHSLIAPRPSGQMQELFLVEATKYNVFPLDNSVLTRVTKLILETAVPE